MNRPSVKRAEEYKFPGTKQRRPGDVMYRTVTIGNNTVLCI